MQRTRSIVLAVSLAAMATAVPIATAAEPVAAKPAKRTLVWDTQALFETPKTSEVLSRG